MNKEAVQNLMVGAVMIVLGYAVFQHFRKPAAPGAAPRPAQGPGGTAQSFAPGAPSPYTGSPFTAVFDLMSGTTQDVGSFGGRNYMNDMADPMLNGNGGRDSIVLPGAPWYPN